MNRLRERLQSQRNQMGAEESQLRVQKIQNLRDRIRTLSSGNIPVGWLQQNDTSDQQPMDSKIDELVHQQMSEPRSLIAMFYKEIEREREQIGEQLEAAVEQLRDRMSTMTTSQLEDVQQMHEEQLRELEFQRAEEYRYMEATLVADNAQLQGRIDYLEAELEKVKDSRNSILDKLFDARENVIEQANEFGRAKEKIEMLAKELAKIQVDTDVLQVDKRNIGSVKKELETYKEINKIIMNAFRNLEEERNDLLVSLERDVDGFGKDSYNRYEKICKMIKHFGAK